MWLLHGLLLTRTTIAQEAFTGKAPPTKQCGFYRDCSKKTTPPPLHPEDNRVNLGSPSLHPEDNHVESQPRRTSVSLVYTRRTATRAPGGRTRARSQRVDSQRKDHHLRPISVTQGHLSANMSSEIKEALSQCKLRPLKSTYSASFRTWRRDVELIAEENNWDDCTAIVKASLFIQGETGKLGEDADHNCRPRKTSQPLARH